MIINSYRHILVLAASIAVSTNFVFAQSKTKTNRKVPNISLNIASGEDSLRSSYFNIGLLTNVNYQKGIGVNIISSTVKREMTGIQISGLVNTVGIESKGLMLSGLTNITGQKATGIMVSGLMNVTGREASGIQASLFGNVVGHNSKGLAIGGLMNVAGSEMSGIHISGLANVSGKNQKGLALAGLMNATARNANGLQIASIINIAGKESKGLQLAAISNVSVKAKGVQVAGLTNIVADTLSGLQLSTILNITQKVSNGVQIAPANYSGKLNGLQIGLVNMNVAESRGTQVGVINYSRDSTVNKIGLININPQTRIQMMLFSGNTNRYSVAARFKNRRTYSVIGLGTHIFDIDDKFSGSIFYKTGLYYPIAKNLEISSDLGYYHIESFKNKNEVIPRRLYALQGNVNLEYSIHKKVSIFASGGYSFMRYYNKNKSFDRKPIFSLGVVLL